MGNPNQPGPIERYKTTAVAALVGVMAVSASIFSATGARDMIPITLGVFGIAIFAHLFALLLEAVGLLP